MKEKIAACAKMLEISEEELFVRAYNICGGRFLGPRRPAETYRSWKGGFCTEPIYVCNFVNRIVATLH